jgi:NAD(P)-dependent dehydrogenase (short-subunit alcohol dehydrogenase family)
MSASQWTENDVPDQSGRVAVITGANTGIGFDTARVLLQRGARVVLACRDLDKARAAAERMVAAADTPGMEPARTRVEVARLDLASLDSIRQAADELPSRHARIDLLINNAGVMDTPYGTTRDGFELQFGINHLGHFALTGLLLERLCQTPGSRIVTVSSLNHRQGTINFDDLQSTRKYRRETAYSQSKLANLMFTFELQRRLAQAQALTQAAGSDGGSTCALAAHPGFAKTELNRSLSPVTRAAYRPLIWLLGQGSRMGALPTLRAAADPAAEGGNYYGPGGRFQAKGYPVQVGTSDSARDSEAQQRLWHESERLTGVAYPF